jgi:hypothetical protein
MKALLVILALVLATSTLFAKPINFISCTTDQKIVVLKTDVADEASTDIVKNIQTAFDYASNHLTAEELKTRIGFQVFFSNLSDESKKAIQITEPPSIEAGSCKIS